MNLITLLASVKKAGAKLQLRNGQLYLKGTIPDELRSAIREHKEALVDLLSQQKHALPALQRLPDNRQMTLAQQRLCFMDQLEGGDIAYIEPFYRYQIQGPLNVEALRRAIHEVIRRHEVLRTRYELGDEPTSLALQTLGTESLDIVDISALDEQAQQQRLVALKQAESLRPFDLQNTPLLRATLIRLGAEQHELLLTAHHIAIDGWSLAVLVKEISQLYAAFALGQDSPLPEPPFQFGDVADWQQQVLGSSATDAGLRYWKQQLSGVPEQCSFPPDQPRPRVQDFRGATLETVIDAEPLGQLKALCVQQQCTLFSGVHALLAILLGRYTHQDDIVIGSPESGRPLAQLQSMVGFFVNNQVLRTDLSARPSFVELLAQVKNRQQQAAQNATIPFEAITEQAGITRSQAYNPLFQVMLVLLNVERPVLVLPGMDVTVQHPYRAQSKFDLTLYAVEIEGRLHLQWEYATALYSAATIKRIAQHFSTLLTAALAAPTSPVDTLSLVDRKQQEWLAVMGAGERSQYPESSVIELFRQQASRTPSAPALLSHSGQSVSYRQLDASSDKLALLMRSRGVNTGDRVGIALARSTGMVTAILAVLKLGACYVPMDPAYPRQRLAHIIDDAALAMVLTDQGSQHALPVSECQTVVLDSDDIAAQRQQCQSLPLAPVSMSGQPLYQLYTSGSTGVPKGVIGSEKATLNRLAWMWRAYPFTQDETCCLKTSLNFVDHVWELFGPLLKGVPLLVLPPSEVQDTERFAGHLAQFKISRLVLVPSLLGELLALDEASQQRLGGLRLWTASGERLSPELVRQFYLAWPDASLLNIYGSTEVSADVTCFDTRALPEIKALLSTAGRRDGAAMSEIPVGKPLPNVQIHILDKLLQPVPQGMLGELFVAGDCLALGYTDPQLTEKAFCHPPFLAGQRAFKTGDLGCWLDDGNLQLQGRADQQIQLRGFRIEPREIEHVMCSQAGISSAKVVLHTDDRGERRLVAYLVSSLGEGVIASVRQAMAKQLPDYMQPSALVVLEDYPLLPNGKVDLHRLPAPAFRADKPAVKAATDTEQLVAKVWREVLGIEDEICTETSFFDMGGHSLLATRVLNRVRARCEANITIRHFLEAPTIKALAMLIDFQAPHNHLGEKMSEGMVEVTL
ncbi:non-ribosomal peptide synthetase [Photobacterium gaetbulicola]|uniref:non-ribosomal peptide synthetase n=1 Tax=Photobacterium gaetbulicola TaxID=1295392 RepID=UPI00068AF945|nr:non-ribosomal peptide synthetase [Photobacterium gaetbulicola]